LSPPQSESDFESALVVVGDRRQTHMKHASMWSRPSAVCKLPTLGHRAQIQKKKKKKKKKTLNDVRRAAHAEGECGDFFGLLFFCFLFLLVFDICSYHCFSTSAENQVGGECRVAVAANAAAQF
jgi:hypothetical protein